MTFLGMLSDAGDIVQALANWQENVPPKRAQASVALWRCAEQRDERTSASITVVPSPVLDPANLWHSLH